MSEPHQSSLASQQSAVATLGRECGADGEKKILLLDGVRLFVHFEQTLLQRENYTIFTASTGAEALDIINKEDIDLVLMDYVLPDQDGDEVVKMIRQHPVNGNAGIIIVTAKGVQENVDSCMAAGCDSFLFKPVSGPVLCSRVQEALSVPARRHVRTLVRLQVNARNRDRFFFGSTINLSEGGVLLSSALELAVGEALSLRYFLPGDEEAISCDSRVVRRNDGEDGEHVYGIVFENLSEADQARIGSFIQRESEGASQEAPVGVAVRDGEDVQ